MKKAALRVACLKVIRKKEGRHEKHGRREYPRWLTKYTKCNIIYFVNQGAI